MSELRVSTGDVVQGLLYGIRRTFYEDALIEHTQHVHNKIIAPLPPLSGLRLIKLNKIRYRDRKDIKYSMASLFSALHGAMQPFVYIVSCCKNDTSIYIGFWESANKHVETGTYMESVIKGFIPGCEFSVSNSSSDIISEISRLEHTYSVVGVPSEKQLFQDEKRNNPMEFGIERLADAMAEDHFALIITASPVNIEESSSYFKDVSAVLDYVHKLGKSSDQHSSGIQKNTNFQLGENESNSYQETQSHSTNEGVQEAPWVFKRWGLGIKKFVVGGKSPSKQTGMQEGDQVSSGTNTGVSNSFSYGEGSSESDSKTVEQLNHQAILAEEILKMIQVRLKTGAGEGLWQTNVLLLTDSDANASKASNVVTGMWSGAQSFQDPIHSIKLTNLLTQHGIERINQALNLLNTSVFSEHPLGSAYSGGYTWITSGELAIAANLPHYELPNLSSDELIDYGRFLPEHDRTKQIELGKHIDRNVCTKTPIWMDTVRLNRHMFVTGLTGSGKSNTIRSVLLELARQGIPFLIIEPVKSEYRELNSELAKRFAEGASKYDHIDVFSLGGKDTAQIILNPFAFETKDGDDIAVALLSHIDRLKAVFNSSLGMYSSMPYILEEMLYKAYANAGWDIETGENKYFKEASQYLGLSEYAELRNLFLPKLSDLTALVDEAIKGFFPKDSDYGVSLVGALKSRLNSLTRGVKGKLLNQRLSLPIESLLNRPCVIELESFADNDEKAFIMALLLSRIYEYRIGKPESELKHVLVIEEAHRLLTKPPQASEHSANSRGKSVEVFADMLAEIRAYGQGIIIADQIPAKLVPDVIKNTNIKIVHRLMAKEDREAVGTAMNLNEKQINDLNKATPGMATVSFDGLNNPLRVQIREIPLTKTAYVIDRQKHQDIMLEYMQNIFLRNQSGAVSSLADEKKAYTYWLVLKLFFIASLSKDTVPLIQFREGITQKNAANKYNARFNENELWAAVSEGISAFIHDMSFVGKNSGEAGIVASAFAAFALPWCNKGIFSLELKRFVQLVCRDEDVCRSKRTENDFFTFMLQQYADRSGFQNDVLYALGKSTVADWSPLQKVLMFYISDLTYNIFPPKDSVIKINIALKLIKCIRTEDEALIKKSGYAYGFLNNILSKKKLVHIAQTLEEII